MKAFRLSASGENFDVDRFLASASLRPSRVVRKGQAKGTSPGFGRYAVNFVEFELGNGRKLTTSEQENIAIEFLTKNRDALHALSQFSGVEVCSLSLHRLVVAGPNLVAFSVETSPQLMWHALNAGCSLTHIVELERPEENDA